MPVARILLTRPAAQCAPLAARLVAAGFAPQPFSPLQLVADTAALQALPALLADAHWLIPVSPGAVDMLRPALPAPLAPGVRLACVGQGSAQRLAALSGRPVLHPLAGSDSEALLALPEMADLAGQTVVIVCGDSGRTLLAETLQARGASVRLCRAYRREACDPGWGALTPARCAQVAAIMVTSSDIARALFASVPPPRLPWLAAQRFVALHPRIAEALAALGAQRIATAATASDGALVAALQAMPA